MMRRLVDIEADQARAELARLADDPRTDTTRGLVDVVGMLARSEIYTWQRRGERLLTFALQAHGREVVVSAAAGGDGRQPIADEFLAELQAQLPGRVLTIETKRRGLVRVLRRHGFSVDAFTLRKAL